MVVQLLHFEMQKVSNNYKFLFLNILIVSILHVQINNIYFNKIYPTVVCG